jgi:hypothetical protein
MACRRLGRSTQIHQKSLAIIGFMAFYPNYDDVLMMVAALIIASRATHQHT